MALAGRHAFVTGGGRGIGRSEKPLQDAVDAGDAAGYGVADVTDAAQVGKTIESAEKERGPVTILVNNAGSVETGPFAKADHQAFQNMWNVHLMGAVHASQAVLPGMVARGFGRIVNVASTAGLKGYPYVSAYCAAKHALVGLTRALAAETATRGITVNAVCPGFADTELLRDSIDRVVEKTGRARSDVLAEYLHDTPIGRLVRPEEVAAAVLYLCSTEAAAVTGTTLAVAGGEM